MVVVKVLQTLLCLLRKRVLLPLIALMFCGLAFAQTPRQEDASLLRVDGTTAPRTSLTPYWSLLSDPTRLLQVQDVLGAGRDHEFTPHRASGNALGLGIRKDAVWLKAHIDNTSDQAIARVFEISYASLNLVDVVLVQANGQVLTHQKMGTARPMSARDMPGRFFNVPLDLPPKSSLILLVRIESHAPIIIPALLWEPQAFAQHDKNDYSVQAWYFGLASAMFTFNVLLLLALRDKVYFQYLFWLTSMLMTVAVGSGLAKQFLWPEAVGWPPYTNALVDNWAAASLFFFMREMLDVRSHSAKLDTLYRALGWFFLFIPLAYLVDFHAVAEVMLMVTSSLAFLILGVAIWVARKGKRAAVIFLVAFSALIVSSVIGGLWGLNILPTNFITVYGFQIGSAVEMILLALALADRVNDSRKAVYAAQAQVLLVERQRVEALQESERALEARVSQRTAELSESLEKLKLAQDELVQAERLASLGSLVAGVAHELNTPVGNALTVSSALSEQARQLRTDVLGNQMRKSQLLQFADNIVPMADLIENSCIRAASLISSFKRVAVDQTSELRREFDLRDLVRDILAAIGPGLKNLPYTIESRVPQHLMCEGYPGPLGQVITNLVQNAAVHAFDGKPDGYITISAREDGDDVEVEVADNGNGIPPEIHKRIFEPFFTTRLGKGGSGLGLAISSNIARSVLHGSLLVTSIPGEGSRFIVRFPRHLPAVAEYATANG